MNEPMIDRQEIKTLINQAFEKIQKQYVVGIVSFYDKQNPNAWWKIFDDMERFLGHQDIELVKKQILIFESRVLSLIEIYKMQNDIPVDPTELQLKKQRALTFIELVEITQQESFL